MTTGLTDLNEILRSMKIQVKTGEFYYMSLPEDVTRPGISRDLTRLYEAAIMQLKEREGLTIVVDADGQKIGEALAPTCRPSKPMGWITINVHSSLESVGLTAALSRALAIRDISANIIAGFYHDHIVRVPMSLLTSQLVSPYSKLQEAVETLVELRESAAKRA